jgi:hypothetical protein
MTRRCIVRVAHAAATICAGPLAFFAIGALQGALLNLLPPRAFHRLSVLFQAVFARAFVAATPYVFDIPNRYEMIAARPRWMLLFPPAWFLGLYETLLGARDGYFSRLRDMAIVGIGTLPFEALGFGWVLAFAHIALVAVLMLWLVEVRLREWHKIPFTALMCQAGAIFGRSWEPICFSSES